MPQDSVALLLRAPSQDSEDKYEARFQASGYTSFSVPVLETVLTNIDELRRIIATGPGIAYHGVIITSGRACEAWKEAVETLEITSEFSDSWQTKPFYVVGHATGSSLSEIYKQHPDSPFVPNSSLIKGQDCGNADQLGRFIVDDLKSSSARLLYLTGDKNRDTLPNILRDGNVGFQSLKVYETQGSSKFAEDLAFAVQETRNNHTEVLRWWIIFFAPSAAQFVLPFLQEHFELPEETSNKSCDGSKPAARVAAIGPTTDTYLRETLHLRVDAMAAKPTPEDLVSAIVSFDSRATL
ncbi:uroporphyrinogen-iii synthase [Moniliophthora roreri]|uniref:Tetrapyrrole biosynthesis uroporphyrinogen III synthase domain-containing protein n=1 Tax=Moniliophthora roreri TaxID=221103 RepID=A0A0W0ETK8_MONRR|nr:uroporphyrinogen-iii synthase [Moniliophthora roreri]